MSLAIVYSRAQLGLDAPLVTVEVHITGGLPGLSIVGLPEAAVRESKDRVRSALLNTGFKFPSRRITINLAPADLPKEGGRFDLPIALGILVASKQLAAQHLGDHEFLGELALTGHLRPIRSTLPASLSARDTEHLLVLPRPNADEAALISNSRILPATHLLEVCAHLNGSQPLSIHTAPRAPQQAPIYEDLADVMGQYQARRALEIAAAGGHNLLFIGPPGTGKSMLATRLPGILPPMEEWEALESAAIQSVSAQGFDLQQWKRRPFRAPHHTASAIALVGGGSHPRPGEISLAHRGVLFLDELPEFDRRVLEVLREPLESGCITVSRAAHQAQFPARFQLVAAMNPCPCGHLGDGTDRCRCAPERIHRYRARVSGPLLDRIDLHIEVPTMRGQLGPNKNRRGETSEQVRHRVHTARQRQLQRRGKPNSTLTVPELAQDCPLPPAAAALLEGAVERLGLSARAWHRIQRVARTIADLAGTEHIEIGHVSEAITYRSLDRAPSPPG